MDIIEVAEYEIDIFGRPSVMTSKQLIEDLREARKALQKVLDDSDIGAVPKAHLNHIEKLLVV